MSQLKPGDTTTWEECLPTKHPAGQGYGPGVACRLCGVSGLLSRAVLAGVSTAPKLGTRNCPCHTLSHSTGSLPASELPNLWGLQ